MEKEPMNLNESMNSTELSLEDKLRLVQEAIAKQNKVESAADPYFVPADPMDALQCESCQ